MPDVIYSDARSASLNFGFLNANRVEAEAKLTIVREAPGRLRIEVRPVCRNFSRLADFKAAINVRLITNAREFVDIQALTDNTPPTQDGIEHSERGGALATTIADLIGNETELTRVEYRFSDFKDPRRGTIETVIAADLRIQLLPRA